MGKGRAAVRTHDNTVAGMFVRKADDGAGHRTYRNMPCVGHAGRIEFFACNLERPPTLLPMVRLDVATTEKHARMSGIDRNLDIEQVQLSGLP